jgi:hypothetical protein
LFLVQVWLWTLLFVLQLYQLWLQLLWRKNCVLANFRFAKFSDNIIGLFLASQRWNIFPSPVQQKAEVIAWWIVWYWLFFGIGHLGKVVLQIEG